MAKTKRKGKQAVVTRKKTGTKKKENKDVTAIITAGADVGQLVQLKDRDDLTAWFNVYMSVEVEPGLNT